MKSKKPFYRHTSILLAVAFTTGIGIGSLSDSLNVQSSQDSILQRSPFVQSVTKKASLDSIGKVLAYEVYDGKVVDDKVGDDLNAPDVPKKVDTTPVPVPKVEKPENQAPVFSYDVSCDYTTVDKPVYKATSLLKNQGVSSLPNGIMRVTIAYKNDGNIPWFSDSSGCANGPVVQLGTTHELDRDSVFAHSDIGSGWAASNRIYMSSPRVDPGQTAMFTFDIKAPSVEDVYREMFGIVIPGVTWVKDSDFGLNVTVGQPYDEETAQKKLFFINGSGRGVDVNLSAEKSVEVDLSEQKATLRLGDYVVRVFSVSTGAPDHPTPVGTWKILFKQQVRIGGAAPFYIMPKWQAIRPDGYGFHGLPSLGNATLRAKIRALGPDEPVPTEWFKTDSFWTEALDHIGSARSHGCVRYLPDDADYIYDFTDIGTPIIVHK
ncbi:L,D-transpeptidase family protein [Candidatus Gracilibacteria bacterium]|nr:L,D-transpeptidase family protein [Candidatus Gracilibacteria bacterium]